MRLYLNTPKIHCIEVNNVDEMVELVKKLRGEQEEFKTNLPINIPAYPIGYPNYPYKAIWQVIPEMLPTYTTCSTGTTNVGKSNCCCTKDEFNTNI